MISSPAKKHCLLIVHREFHDFEKFLTETFISKGYRVTVANDVYPTNLFGKLLGKLQIPTVYHSTYNHIVTKFLDNKTYDIAVIIRGRGISLKLIKKIKESIPYVIGYNWDTFKFNSSPLKWLNLVNKYYTFDYADAQQYQLPILELFSASPKSDEKGQVKYKVAAIGKNYYGRLKYMHSVLQAIKPESFYMQLHENNVFFWALNFLKNPGLYLRYWRHINMKPLAHNDYIDALSSAEFVIDYANNGQTGITMRCFESIALQTKIITNNNYLLRCKYFNEFNTIVFVPGKTPVELFKHQVNQITTHHTLTVRSINDFVDELIA